MRHPTSSVPSAQKIEPKPTTICHFGNLHLCGVDCVSCCWSKMESRKLVNADQPQSHQGGEDGKDKVKVVINRIPDWMDCNCKCHKFDDNTGMVCPHCHPEDYELRSEPSSPQDAKPAAEPKRGFCPNCRQKQEMDNLRTTTLRSGKRALEGERSVCDGKIYSLESGQAGEWEQRFDDDFINCFYDVDGNYHKESVRDFIKQELARQLSEIKLWCCENDYNHKKLMSCLDHLDQEEK